MGVSRGHSGPRQWESVGIPRDRTYSPKERSSETKPKDQAAESRSAVLQWSLGSLGFTLCSTNALRPQAHWFHFPTHHCRPYSPSKRTWLLSNSGSSPFYEMLSLFPRPFELGISSSREATKHHYPRMYPLWSQPETVACGDIA